MQQWNKNELGNLAAKYLQGSATEEEVRQLMEWYHAFDENDLTVIVPAENENEEAATEIRMFYQLQHLIKQQPVKRRKSYYISRFSAAAAVLTAAAFTWLWLAQNTDKPAFKPKHPSAGTSAVKPGGNKAVLTLADGSTIVLDSAQNGTLSHQAGSNVIKLATGQLAYNKTAGTDNSNNTTVYNTITTPKGGQYQIILPDGSTVWLNAASSLRFPTSFTGSSRQVYLTGEACFEIAPNANAPFKVNTPSTEVCVLGTLFNIMAYQDEPAVQTTLVSGRISVAPATDSAGARMLRPGQQARNRTGGQINIIDSADIEEALAWKNGRFQFDAADVSTVLRQISRWYDIEIIYKGSVNGEQFTGEIPRNSSIEEVCKILKLSNIHFIMDGRTMTVTP